MHPIQHGRPFPSDLQGLEQLDVEGFIPNQKGWKLRKELAAQGRPRGRMKEGLTRTERELRTKRGEAAYKAGGQTKHGFQSLTRRGLQAAKADWAMLCLTHNVKKLWKAKKAA